MNQREKKQETKANTTTLQTPMNSNRKGTKAGPGKSRGNAEQTSHSHKQKDH